MGVQGATAPGGITVEQNLLDQPLPVEKLTPTGTPWPVLAPWHVCEFAGRWGPSGDRTEARETTTLDSLTHSFIHLFILH